MKFTQIVILDNIRISESSLKLIQSFSKNPLKVYESDPQSEQETQKRLANADCAILSWRSSITKETLDKCTNLKFIGLAATNSNCIDLTACHQKGITITTVKDYGDIGVVEWIFLELLLLLRGSNDHQWRQGPSELSGKTFGIIGLGTIGKMLADVAIGFKMNVIYHSRTRNPQWESKGLSYLPKDQLIKLCDIITLQTPKNVKVLDESDFKLMKEKILVNNTLGKAFNPSDFEAWIRCNNNFAIMDKASDFHNEFQHLDRVIFSDFVSGLTNEALERLGQKISDNIKNYLNGC